MSFKKSILLAITVFALPAMTSAADIDAGKTKAVLCGACHGSDGMATQAIYPNLAGQNEAYLASSLKAYRSKDRNGGLASIMQIQASRLSDDDIADLAAYFSSLK